VRDAGHAYDEDDAGPRRDANVQFRGPKPGGNGSAGDGSAISKAMPAMTVMLLLECRGPAVIGRRRRAGMSWWH
jgi:hypothetical protein